MHHEIDLAGTRPGARGIEEFPLFGRHQNWLNLSLEVDLESLPAKLDYSPATKFNLFFLLAGFFQAAFSIWILGHFDLGVALSLLMMGAAAGSIWMMLYGVFRLSLRRRAVFYPEGVEVAVEHLLGRSQWRLRYSDFEGVLYREVTAKEGTAAAKVFRVIELFHPEKKRRVPLYADYAAKRPLDNWEAYGARFGLPLLEEEGEAIALRKDKKCKKSIRQRAADGELTYAYDPNAPLPKGLEIAQERIEGEEALTVTFRAWVIPKSTNAAALSFLLPIGTAPFTSDLADGWFSYALYILPGVAVLAFAHLLWFRLKPQRLRLTREGLSVSGGCLSQEMAAVTLTLAEVWRMDIEKSRSANFAHDLVLEDGDNELAFGHGLSREQLIWLGNFITAAIATA